MYRYILLRSNENVRYSIKLIILQNVYPVVKFSASNYKKIRPHLVTSKHTLRTPIRVYIARNKMVIIHILELMNFVVNVSEREREPLYTRRFVCGYKRARKKSTRASNKSGSLPRAYPSTLSFQRQSPPFSRTVRPLPLPPPRAAIATNYLTFLFFPGRLIFKSPRRGAIVLTSIFYISLQPLNALNRRCRLPTQPGIARGISHACISRAPTHGTRAPSSIREYDAM